MNRLQNTFTQLKAQGKSALIPFMTAGDPDPAMTPQLMQVLVAAGADIIELGVVKGFWRAWDGELPV